MEEIRVWFTIEGVYGSYLTAEGAFFNGGEPMKNVWKHTNTYRNNKLIKTEKELY